MVRSVLPALGMYVNNEDGWSELSHKIHAGNGWFCWKDAPFYLEFDRGLGNTPRAKYEKIMFESFSFVENVMGGMPSITFKEEQIISRKEISEEEYRKITNR